MKERVKTASKIVLAVFISMGVVALMFFAAGGFKHSFLKLFGILVVMFGGAGLLQAVFILLGILGTGNLNSGFYYSAAIYYGGFFIKVIVDAYCWSEVVSGIIGFAVSSSLCLAFGQWYKLYKLKSENNNGHNT